MNNWHTFWLLRPLIVFAIACPTFIIVALLSLHKKSPDADSSNDAEDSSKTQSDQSPLFVLSASGTSGPDGDSRAQSAPAEETNLPTQKRAA